MRLVLAFAVFFAPLATQAQSTRLVEVTNLPAVQDVNVVNAPPGGGSAPFQLVGFTTATFTGGQGVLGFTRACQQEFPGSRMCSSPEVMETTELPASLAGLAWVRPSFVAPGTDASGRIVGQYLSFLSCYGWSSSGGEFGLALDGAGRFQAAPCSEAHPTACCAVVP